jgi:hypothetical protein
MTCARWTHAATTAPLHTTQTKVRVSRDLTRGDAWAAHLRAPADNVDLIANSIADQRRKVAPERAQLATRSMILARPGREDAEIDRIGHRLVTGAVGM